MTDEPKRDALNELGGTNAYWLGVETSRIAMADALTAAGIPVGIEQRRRVEMLAAQRDAARIQLAKYESVVAAARRWDMHALNEAIQALDALTGKDAGK